MRGGWRSSGSKVAPAGNRPDDRDGGSGISTGRKPLCMHSKAIIQGGTLYSMAYMLSFKNLSTLESL